MSKMTPKQKKFIEFINQGKTRANAYKMAYEREDLSNVEASKRASALLKKPALIEAQLCTKNKLTENPASVKTLIKRLELANQWAFELMEKGDYRRNIIDTFFKSSEHLRAIRGNDYCEVEKTKALWDEMKLKRERLEFDKSKIKKDNEDLQKENASLLRQLISK